MWKAGFARDGCVVIQIPGNRIETLWTVRLGYRWWSAAINRQSSSTKGRDSHLAQHLGRPRDQRGWPELIYIEPDRTLVPEGRQGSGPASRNLDLWRLWTPKRLVQLLNRRDDIAPWANSATLVLMAPAPPRSDREFARWSNTYYLESAEVRRRRLGGVPALLLRDCRRKLLPPSWRSDGRRGELSLLFSGVFTRGFTLSTKQHYHEAKRSGMGRSSSIFGI